MQVPINSITIPDRFREDMGDINELATSMKNNGLIQPIVLDGDTLIAGARRLSAATSLAWTHIEAVQMDNLSPIQRRTIELEENIKRKSFTWQEEIAAKAEILALRQSEYGTAKAGSNEGYGMGDLASELGETKMNISRDVTLANAIKIVPELANEKNKSRARSKMCKLIKLIDMSNQVTQTTDAELPWRLHNVDCRVGIQNIQSETIDLVFTDPPFGMEMDIKGRVEYKDDLLYVLDILEDISTSLYQKMKPNSHLYMCCAIQYWHLLRDIYEAAGFHVHNKPIIDVFSDHIMNMDTGNFQSCYSAIMFAEKGHKPLLRSHQDVLDLESSRGFSKTFHPVELPKGPIELLLNLSSIPGQMILDPFAGSGTTLVVATELARRSIGFEIDTNHYNTALMRLNTL